MRVAWTAWHQRLAATVVLQQSLRRIMMVHLHDLLLAALQDWAAHTEARRGKKDNLQRAVAAWTKSYLRSAFNGWLEHADKQRRLKAAALKVVVRWSHMSLHTAFQVCHSLAGL